MPDPTAPLRPLVRGAGRWFARLSPTAITGALWVVFVLACYPGYLSYDSVVQLGEVRSGVYSDALPPVMTFVWSAFENVVAGPFPMLALQSGLFVFGLAAVLRHVVSPRAAAISAGCILLAPPVFAPMAVIWSTSLMTGALVAALAGFLDPRRGGKLAGAAALVLALACRPEVVVAAPPLALMAVVGVPRWRRVAAAVAIVVACAGVARVATSLLTDRETYARQQNLELMDVIGTLRRAGPTTDAAARGALAGLHRATNDLAPAINAGHDAYDAYPFAFGDHKLIEPVDDDDTSRALGDAWRRAIAKHPGAYATHRIHVAERLLGLSGPWTPVFDDFGDRAMLAPLHHRATASDVELATRVVVRAVAATPLFRPWLYVLLAIGAVVLARRRPVLRALAASGLAYELGLVVLASSADYRESHWLVAATWAALVALAVARRFPARTP